MSNNKKSEQLGMNFGTANMRLRKLILFSLIVKLNENVCFQCNKIIENVDELSIEHKIPWQNNSSDLFWDLNNIAFSHLKCNISAADKTWTKNPRPNSRHIVNETLAWCSGCKQAVDKNMFTKNKNTWSGLSKYCKRCRKSQRNAALS